MIADVYLHPDLPALVRVFGSDFKLVEHAIAINEEDEIILDAQASRLYYVVDIREIKLSLDDMIKGANMAAHQFKNYRHPQVIETLIVVPNRLYEMAANSLTSSVFGSLKLQTYYSIEEALDHITQRQGVLR